MDMVLDKIAGVTYTRLPSGTAIVCEIQMRNMHLCHGIAVVVDMDNDDAERGKKVAYDKAVTQVFDYVAYDLHNKMDDDTGLGPDISNRHLVLCNEHKVVTNGHPVLLT
jgi:hypothetical protein